MMKIYKIIIIIIKITKKWMNIQKNIKMHLKIIRIKIVMKWMMMIMIMQKIIKMHLKIIRIKAMRWMIILMT